MDVQDVGVRVGVVSSVAASVGVDVAEVGGSSVIFNRSSGETAFVAGNGVGSL